ncbi:2OG-Fe(II) oxygenase [Aliikangiella maris]|uniref:2OG-Fe(II) oxygenase n=2 Tax=Aliikangiella maris TaxID=3162458 RepID=A0ABV3MN83_9GAMM
MNTIKKSVVSEQSLLEGLIESNNDKFPLSVSYLTNKLLVKELLKKLIERVESKPSSNIFQQIVNLNRCVGDFYSVKKYLKKWLSIYPYDKNANYLYRLFIKNKIDQRDYDTNQVKPASFKIYSEFLNRAEHDYFISKVIRHESSFKDDGIFYGDRSEIDKTKRYTKFFKLNDNEKQLFIRKLAPKVDGLLNNFLLEKLAIKEFELKLTVHPKGGFFHIHQDGFYKIRGGVRVLSWIYYFYNLPKNFTGGDLILFDSNCNNENHQYHQERFTRYIPVDNQLIIFPSHFFHGVTPVDMPVSNFISSRFAISGHIRF